MSGQQIIRLSDVKAATGLSVSTIYRLASEEKFPKPIKLGSRSSGWVASEIQQWLTDRIKASRPEVNKLSQVELNRQGDNQLSPK